MKNLNFKLKQKMRYQKSKLFSLGFKSRLKNCKLL